MLEVTVTHNGEMDLIASWSETLKKIGRGQIDNDVAGAAYRVIDKRFNKAAAAAAASPDSKIRHMFEWGMYSPSQAARLWKTVIVGSVVSYTFIESKKKVPLDPRLKEPFTKPDHIFRKKAEISEKGQGVWIEPKEGKYLRWYQAPGESSSGSADIAFTKKAKDGYGKEVFATAAARESVEGGEYVNEFDNFFMIYWATAGEKTSTELSQIIGSSSAFRDVRDKKYVRTLNSRLGGHQSVLRSSRTGSEAKRKSAEQIAKIKQELKRYGR